MEICFRVRASIQIKGNFISRGFFKTEFVVDQQRDSISLLGSCGICMRPLSVEK